MQEDTTSDIFAVENHGEPTRGIHRESLLSRRLSATTRDRSDRKP